MKSVFYSIRKLDSFNNWSRGRSSNNGLNVWLFFLWFSDFDNIRVRCFRSDFASWIVWQHNFNFKTDDTLSKKHVTNGGIDILSDGVTGMDHETVREFHGFCSLSSQFTRNDDFTALSSGFHDESKNTISSTSDSQTSHEFVSERFALSDGAETSVCDLFSKKFNLSVFHLESLLYDGGQFSNSLSLVSQDILCSGGKDDNFGSFGSNSDFDTGITVFGKFLSQETVQFCAENAFSN